MPKVKPFACASDADITNPLLGFTAAAPSTFIVMVTLISIPPTFTVVVLLPLESEVLPTVTTSVLLEVTLSKVTVSPFASYVMWISPLPPTTTKSLLAVLSLLGVDRLSLGLIFDSQIEVIIFYPMKHFRIVD